MRNLFKTVATSLLVAAAAIFTSCSSDDNLGLENIIGEENNLKTLTVSQSDPYPELSIVSNAGKTDTINVKFIEADKNLRRLYITKIKTNGEKNIYDISKHVIVTLNKDDNSIDLSKDNKKEINFKIPFDAPEEKGGVVVYKLWTTNSPFLSSKGDIENSDFRNAYNNGAFGTIIIKTSNETVSTPVKEFTVELGNSISLNAPAANGSTKSFVSILNGKTYKIAQQKKDITKETFTDNEKAENAEFVSYWDFGYFYTDNASFSSTYDYMSAFQVKNKTVINITNISGLSQDQLNKFYFSKDSSISFDAVKNSEDLNGVSANNQTISNLEEGDIIQFVDRNNVKGLIRIDKIVKGYDTDDYIKFSVKVQNVDFIKL